MTLQFLQSKSGSHTLLLKDGKYFISVICGDLMIYPVNFPLTVEQATEIQQDAMLMDELVERIRASPMNFSGEHVDLVS